MSEWLPIETAPLGVQILAVVGWPKQRYVRYGEMCISSDGKDYGARYFWVYGSHGGERATANCVGEPTHWMPLPDAPK